MPNPHLPTIDPSQFTMIPDYDATSQYYYCSTCGMPHRGIGTGEPVFRGADIPMEGYYDICIDCARHVGDLAGMIKPEQVDATVIELVAVRDMLEEQTKEIGELYDVVDAYQLIVSEFHMVDDDGEEE